MTALTRATHRLRSIVISSCVTVTILMGAFPLSAQLTLPEIRQTGPVMRTNGTHASIVKTPLHALFETRLEREGVEQIFSTTSPQYPKDSLLSLWRQRADTRLRALPAVQDLAHRPVGLLALMAQQDGRASDEFTRFFQSRTVSSSDRASLYLAMVTAYTDIEHPDRFPQAEAAFTKLKAHSPGWLRRLANLESEMAKVAYQLGWTDKVIAHAEGALALARSNAGGIGDDGYELRRGALNEVPLNILAQAYAGRADGAARIAAMITSVRAAIEPTPQEVSSMSMESLMWIPTFREHIETKLAQLGLWGQTAPPVSAHAWINSKDSDGQAKPPQERRLNDGTARVLIFGNVSCNACMYSLTGMERLYQTIKQYGAAEVMYVTQTLGSWGVDIVEPGIEVPKMRDYYTNTRKVTFPIAVWAGEKIAAEDGTKVSQPSPNTSAYNITGTPTFMVVDGRGKIRYVMTGYKGRPTEEELAKVVAYVLNEAKGTHGAQ